MGVDVQITVLYPLASECIIPYRALVENQEPIVDFDILKRLRYSALDWHLQH